MSSTKTKLYFNALIYLSQQSATITITTPIPSISHLILWLLLFYQQVPDKSLKFTHLADLLYGYIRAICLCARFNICLCYRLSIIFKNKYSALFSCVRTIKIYTRFSHCFALQIFSVRNVKFFIRFSSFVLFFSHLKTIAYGPLCRAYMYIQLYI